MGASMYQEMLNYNAAYQALEHFTVGRAIHYLKYIFDCGSHEVLAPQVAINALTIVDLGRPYLTGILANKLAIRFWGGPPNGEDWFEGTLLTLLMDKLFYCVAMGYTDTIDQFLGSLHGGKTNIPM